MSDPCLAEFNYRIARIEKARAKGYGFEAEGTLGRSTHTWYNQQHAGKGRRLRPFFVLLVCATLVKALFLHQLGTTYYNDRVAVLIASDGFDRISGFFMQADPVTWTVASGMDRLDPV
jgi:hypothetical protein